MPSTPARRLIARVALVAAGVGVLSVQPSSATAADTYPIQLSRPYKVGQEFAVVADGHSDQTVKVSANGMAQPDRVEKYAAQMTGTEKVLAVNETNGEASKLQVTVEKLTKDGVELFPAGTVIVADRGDDGQPAFSANGADVEADKAGVLGMLVDITRPGKKVGADAMFGTTKPQPVGGQWDGNAAGVAADLAGDGLPVSAEHLKASSKLLADDPVDGKPVETIETTIAADPLEVGKRVKTLTVAGGSMSVTVKMTLPVDAARPAMAEDNHLTLKMQGTANGGVVTADIVLDRTVRRTLTPKM